MQQAALFPMAANPKDVVYTPIPHDLQALLSKPVLWPEEVERVQRLARRYKVAVRIERRDFADWPAGWRQVETSGDEED